MNYHIDQQAADSLPAEVRKGIREADPCDVGPRDWEATHFALTAEDGSVAGGVYGATMWGWLMIDGLWVSERLRGKGYGTKLLLSAEQAAMDRGCVGSWLGTFDFQAREFYERHGYVVFSELQGFPPGHTHYHLRKIFDRGEESAIPGPSWNESSRKEEGDEG